MRRERGQSPRERGQSLVEATFVLLAFFAMLVGVIDCGQVLVAHQSLVERVRSAGRWAAVHPWDGPDPIRNLVLYGQVQSPNLTDPAGYLGMTPANVQVTYQQATEERPDDEMLTVAIVNFESHFFSPWFARVLITPRPVMITIPMPRNTAAVR
jgi:hypothetical protein